MMAQRTYGIVGRGKLASHLYHYFSLEGLSVRQWHRDSLMSPQDALASCDVIIVAIKDDQIAHWVEQNQHLTPQYWVHCSGALVVPGIYGFHPLYTFSEQLYDFPTYKRIPFVCEAEDKSFADIFPSLTNPCFTISKGDKVLYHALCVMMGNLATILWQKGFDLAQTQLALDPSVFAPFLQQTLTNTIHNPQTALTGPMDRRDWQTIDRHLQALPDEPLKQIYQHFLTLFSGYPCPY